MKIKLTSLAAALVLTGSFSQVWAASTNSDQQQMLQDMQILIKRTKQLEHQVDSLEHKVHVLERQKSIKTTRITKHRRHATHNTNTTEEGAYETLPYREGVIPYDVKNVKVHVSREPHTTPYWHHYPHTLVAGDKVITYLIGMPVATAPYVSENPAFDASDILATQTKTYQDMFIMVQRSVLEKDFVRLGNPLPDRPFMLLSGKLEPLAFAQKPFVGDSNAGVDLGSAELDVAAVLNPWVEGMMTFEFDGASPSEGGQTVSNSNVFLEKGYVNIGNLNKTPLYMTMGQFFPQFGRYSSYMVSSPLTQPVGRQLLRSLLFGYRHMADHGFYASAWGYQSDIGDGDDNAGGANIGYDFSENDGKFYGDIGASITSSLGDAQGFQHTGGSDDTFGGFGVSNATEMVNMVPGYDLHAGIGIGPFYFLGEYVAAAQDFNEQDLSFNGGGAQPQALNIEGAYNFKIHDKPSALAIGYGMTEDALALNLPHQRIVGVFNISCWRDTIESLELRHDIDYSASDFASGIGATTNTTGTGKSSNTATIQIGVYF